MLIRVDRIIKNSDFLTVLWISYLYLINNLRFNLDRKENELVDLKGLSLKLIIIIYVKDIYIAALVKFDSAN